MKQSIKWTCTLAFALAACLTLSACNQSANAEGDSSDNRDTYAKVIESVPIKKKVDHKSQECHNEVVTQKKPVKDQHGAIGSAIGAVAGGLLGNQIGGGHGKDLSTIAGAVGGGIAGHQVQKKHQQNATEQVNKRVCKTVNNPTTEVTGYKVTYEYKGKQYTQQMDKDPGSRVLIEENVKAVAN